MARRPRTPETLVVETFASPYHAVRQMEGNAPSVGNGEVRVRRYRVTVEEIKEDVEVLRERVRSLWRTSSNHHHTMPLQAAAKELGFELDRAERGIEATDRY